MPSGTHYTHFKSFHQQNNRAKELSPSDRQKLAIKVLAQQHSITELSRQHKVSRKFIYQQKEKASQALEETFSHDKHSQPLFNIQVTPQWLEQIALSLVLTCHSSYGGVVEFFRDIFDQSISKGTICNLVKKAQEKAVQINREQDLSAIQVGAHDEIFQGGKPVLVGCDVRSTYTYLLSAEDQRDGDTWAIRLLELSDLGMKLNHTIADGGRGLRAGQKEAWPGVPCRGDIFHPLYEMGKCCVFLENRVAIAFETVLSLERKMDKAKKTAQGAKYSKQLGHARQAYAAAIRLYQDMRTLAQWLQEDIFSVTGPGHAIQQELLHFVIEELKAREPQAPHRLRPIRSLLEKQGRELLLFAGQLEEDLQELSHWFEVNPELIRQIVVLKGIPTSSNRHWTLRNELYKKIGAIFYDLEKAVTDILESIVRASSMVENINSRLRNYFFLRKNLGQEYLSLLQFFFNHRRFLRSRLEERVGKSPRELLTNQPHAHWLEELGYTLFSRPDKSSRSRSKQSAENCSVGQENLWWAA